MLQIGNPPLVTIGVPVYNGERFLAETLDCLIGQSYRNVEIIVADNASTDGTGDLVQRYARLDSRVRHVHHRENVGAAGNIRRFASMINGKYFKLSNADDLCDKDMVEACVGVLESNEDVVLSCALSRLVDMQGNHIREYCDDMHICSDDVLERFGRVIERIRLTNSIQGVARAEIMRELLPRHGSYDGADMVVLAAIAARGSIHQIPRLMFHRRIHEWSASSKVGDTTAMQAYLDPSKVGTFSPYLSRIHAGYIQEALNAPVDLTTRLRLVWKVIRSGVAQRSALASEWLGVLRRQPNARRA